MRERAGQQLGRTQQELWPGQSAAAQLREQVNQIASQQGWSQAQAEAVFREQMAQQASQQGLQQALRASRTSLRRGLQAEQWSQQQQQKYEQDLYGRHASRTNRYGGMWRRTRRITRASKRCTASSSAQYLLPWEQQSTLAEPWGQATTAVWPAGAKRHECHQSSPGAGGTAQAGVRRIRPIPG